MRETLYKLPTAAAMLSVHPRTLKRWHADGKLRFVELPGGQYRVPSSEVARILEPQDSGKSQDRTDERA